MDGYPPTSYLTLFKFLNSCLKLKLKLNLESITYVYPVFLLG